MSSRSVAIWTHERLERTRWLTLAGAIGLIPLSMFAASVTWWAVYYTLVRLLRYPISLSGEQLSTFSWSVVAIAYLWQLAATWHRSRHAQFGGYQESFAEHLMMEAAQSSSSFGEYMLRRETAVLAWFLFIFSMGPQFLCLSIALFRRALALKRLDDETAERVLAAMMKGQSRLPLDEIRERFKPTSQMELIGGLTALDGVVLIGAETDSPALTVAPRLNEDYKDWLVARREQQAPL